MLAIGTSACSAWVPWSDAEQLAVAERPHVIALLVGAAQAEEARAAGGVEAAEHAVADADPGDVVAGGEHGPDELVADREPGLDLDPPVVDVQVRAADAARLDRARSRRRAASSSRLRALLERAPLRGAWKVTALIIGLIQARSVKKPSPVWSPSRPDSASAAAPARRGSAPRRVRRTGLEHGEHVIEADLVGPAEEPARVVEAVDHAGVDVRRAADALAERERGLVDHLADDPAEDEPRRVVDPDGVLAERREEPLGRVGGEPCAVGASGQLDQLRLGERRQRVEADRGAAGIERRERARRTQQIAWGPPCERRVGLLAAGQVEDQERRLASPAASAG